MIADLLKSQADLSLASQITIDGSSSNGISRLEVDMK